MKLGARTEKYLMDHIDCCMCAIHHHLPLSDFDQFPVSWNYLQSWYSAPLLENMWKYFITSTDLIHIHMLTGVVKTKTFAVFTGGSLASYSKWMQKCFEPINWYCWWYNNYCHYYYSPLRPFPSPGWDESRGEAWHISWLCCHDN